MPVAIMVETTIILFEKSFQFPVVNSNHPTLLYHNAINMSR